MNYKYGLWVCAIAGLFLVFEFTLQVSPSVMTQFFMKEFEVDALVIGTALSAYYYSYSSMQLIGGYCFDHFGSKRTLAVAIFVCALGTTFIATAHSVWLLSVGRFLTGLGSACAYVGLLFLGRQWFAAKYFFIVVGVTQFLGCAGAVLGQGPAALLVNAFGWRGTLVGLSIVGYLLTLLAYFFVRDYTGADTKKTVKEKIPTSVRLKFIFSEAQIWIVGAYAFFIFLPIVCFAALWGVPFLQKFYQMSTAMAALACSMVWIGMGLGSPLAGWISERIASRNIPLWGGAVLGVVTTLLILFVPMSLFWLLVMLFLFGAATAGQSLSFNVINDITPHRFLGATMGLNNLLIVISGAIAQPLVGIFLRYGWDHSILEGVPQYSIQNYQHALLILPISCAIAALIGKFAIVETRCLSRAC